MSTGPKSTQQKAIGKNQPLPWPCHKRYQQPRGGKQVNNRWFEAMGEKLRDRINNEVKVAMKARDQRRLSTLRLINAAIKDRDIQNRGTGKDESLDEAGLLAILGKMIKQRHESAKTYDQGGRPELAQGEREEIAIIEEFMPQQMSPEDQRTAVEQVIKDLECTGLKDMGRAMAALKEKYAGQMDMGKASALVKELLG